MNESEFREELRRRRAADEAKAPVKHVRDLLHGFFSDADSLSEVRGDLASVATAPSRPLLRYLRALETLLADPSAQDQFARLVTWDANWALEDPSPAGAMRFLEEVADMLRQIIDELGPRGGSTGT